MSNETKRDVFEQLLKAYQDLISKENDDENYRVNITTPLNILYDAALPDDLPVIPKAVSEYIKKAKACGKWGLLDVFLHLGDHISDMGFNGLYDWEYWMVDNQDAVSRAWLDGVCIVEGTGEIVKLEATK